MQCLVLGGTGFVGSHVVEALNKAGHSVRVMSRRRCPYWQPPLNVESMYADWNNAEALDRALSGVEVVVHLIGTTQPASSNADMLGDVESNLSATLRLLQLCIGHGVRRVVFASSGGTVYGIPQQVPIAEDHPTYPLCSYGIVKLAIEKYLHLYYQLYGLQYIVLRGSNPYGARQSLQGHQGFIGASLGRLAQGQPVRVWGDGLVVRDYMYIADMAHAFQLAVDSQLEHGVFNVGSGIGLSLVDILNEIGAVAGCKVPILWEPSRPVDVPVNVLDSRRIKEQLGWEPKVMLGDGLCKAWRWVREQVEQEAAVIH